MERVRRTALKLAEEECACDKQVVELAALLHDIRDWKYSGSESASADAIREILGRLGYPHVEAVVAVVEGVSYRSELGKELKMTPELAVVQDADRLDAIGAVGVARAFSFGGSRSRALWDPEEEKSDGRLTKEEYAKRAGSTVQHFYDKLLHIAAKMKSAGGRRMAQARQAYMEGFLEEFFAECRLDK